MRVLILKVDTNEDIWAAILNGRKYALPSIKEKWRFNFNKHSKDKGAQTYVLVTEESPSEIEGCLIYKMLNDQEPYMAYIEIAPHNKGENRRFDLVAACLIAYACRLSFQLGKDHFQGWLAFDVMEEKEEDQLKLMAVYSKKYKAKRIDKTTAMIIAPEDGEKLIEKYLNA